MSHEQNFFVPNGLEIAQNWLGTIYHSPADEADQSFDYEAGADYTRAVFHTVLAIANGEERHTWKTDSFFGRSFGPQAPTAAARAAGRQ